MEGGTGSVGKDGVGPKVRQEEGHHISEKSPLQQVVPDACHRG